MYRGHNISGAVILLLFVPQVSVSLLYYKQFSVDSKNEIPTPVNSGRFRSPVLHFLLHKVHNKLSIAYKPYRPLTFDKYFY